MVRCAMTKQLRAKCPYGKKSHSEGFLRRSVFTAKWTYGEIFLQQTVRAAKCPYGEISDAEKSYSVESQNLSNDLIEQ